MADDKQKKLEEELAEVKRKIEKAEKDIADVEKKIADAEAGKFSDLVDDRKAYYKSLLDEKKTLRDKEKTLLDEKKLWLDMLKGLALTSQAAPESSLRLKDEILEGVKTEMKKNIRTMTLLLEADHHRSKTSVCRDSEFRRHVFEYLRLPGNAGCMVCRSTPVEAAHIVPLTESKSFFKDHTLDFDSLNDPSNAVVLCQKHHDLFDAYQGWFTDVTETGAYFYSVIPGTTEYTRVFFDVNHHPSIPALNHHAEVAAMKREELEAHGEDPDLSTDDDSTKDACPASLSMKDVEAFNWQCPIRRGLLMNLIPTNEQC